MRVNISKSVFLLDIWVDFLYINILSYVFLLQYDYIRHINLNKN